VTTVGKIEENGSEDPPTPCDVCTGDKQRAVTFCPDCMKKMCAEHFKVSNTYHSNNTQQLSLTLSCILISIPFEIIT